MRHVRLFRTQKSCTLSDMTPTRVTLISGFLGSGKTTLLKRVAQNEALGAKVAILINEFAELGLDESLILASRTTPTLQIKQMESGCICCSPRGELADALRELCARTPAPERILIEPSGISQASEIAYAIHAIGCDVPLALDAVITLVDAKNAHRAHKEHPDEFEDQVRTADLILLNKCDLISATKQQELFTWLTEFAPRAIKHATVQADIALDLLLGLVSLTSEKTPLSSKKQTSFQSLTIPIPFVVLEETLEDCLSELADDVFRIKGIVDVKTKENLVQPTIVHAVGDQLDWEEIPQGSFLLAEKRRLLFIGSHLPEKRIRQKIFYLQEQSNIK